MGQTLLGDQFTKEQAIEFAESRRWEPLSFEERARLVLTQTCLCMPFAVAHEAVEKALGRSVWTHEFVGMDLLLAELDGRRTPPTMGEIVEMIPAEKRIVVAIDPD